MASKRHYTSLVLAAGIFSLLVAVCFRFRDGVPMGVDSSSHLFKVLFIYKTFSVGGSLPSWCSEWYGGTAFLLSYPPLAYGISFLFSIITKDPLLSYKILDAVFYAIGPIALAYLINHLGFTKGEAAISAVLFALSPIVMENYLFFDRFNTTISIPLLCLFLVALL